MSDPKMDESLTLSRLAASGEHELALLFSRVREQLQHVIETRLDRRLSSRVDSSDIVQDVYLRASQGLNNFLESPAVHPVVWLRLIAKHMVAETHRRHFRAKRTPNNEANPIFGDGDLLVEHMADAVLSGSTSLERREVVAQVRNLLTELPAHDREVLEMRHIDGMAMADIAASLDITTEAAKKRYYRALARFRTLATDLLATDP